MFNLYRKSNLVAIIVIICVINSFAKAVKWEDFWLYDPNSSCVWGLTHAGYSDSFDWNYSVRHNGSHEMLSGEWAAALSWSQGTSTQIYWLTDWFEYPDFSTGTIFEAFGNPSLLAWDNPNNPASNSYDSAYAVIRNTLGQNNIEIRMDYELVDLGTQDVNGTGGSPIVYRNSSGNIAYVNSERWILLCTYSVKNLSASTINDVELYQMLCGLSGYAYYSSYTSENYYDPLSTYIPYNSVHQIGNFKHDIAQWGQGDPNEDHVDWICFSSTVPPSNFENGMFYSGGGEPTTGTYVNIESRSLNNQPFSVFSSGSYNRVAGAMQFNLGTLAPNELKKITLAVMFGCGPVQHTPPIPPYDVNLTVDINNVDGCVRPSIDGFWNSQIIYDVNYSINCDVNDVNIVATLPDWVDYNSSDPCGYFNAQSHTVTWNLGDFDVNESGNITLTVRVPSNVNQGETLENIIRMYSSDDIIRTATASITVCCDYNTIYVDDDAQSGGNGYSWDTAFQTIEQALANITICTEKIFVAAGTYQISQNQGRYVLVDGIDIFGHFQGCESDISQRNLADSNFASVLLPYSDYQTIVTAADCTIDGFRIQNGNYGIECDYVDTSISNCLFINNLTGINVNDSSIKIYNCSMYNDGYYYNWGIESYNTNLEVDQCTILGGNAAGIEIGGSNATAIITNSVIGGNSGYGVYATCKFATVRNCDVNDNGNGIKFDGNCIIGNVERCHIYRNETEGVTFGFNCDVNIVTNIISDNDSAGIHYIGGTSQSTHHNIVDNFIYGNLEGIHCESPWSYQPIIEIRNNTIVYNDCNGIRYDPDQYDPNVNSNIIWGNTQSLDGTFTKVKYNCIQGGYNGTGNTSVDPQLSNYYLTSASTSCINAGNPNYVAEANETDIDGEYRIINSRVDIGADEFNPYDLTLDHAVDFYDFASFANHWQQSCTPTASYNFNGDSIIDYKDLQKFCQYWLYSPDWLGIGGDGTSFTDTPYQCPGSMQMMMPLEMQSEQMMESEQEYYYPIDYNYPPVYLTIDDNTPDVNDEVTIYINSESPLFAMGLSINIVGDVNITSAMCEADCNQYGWDNGWNSDPYIDDVNGSVYLGGVRWASDANGVVSYVKFKYNGGDVDIYLDTNPEWSMAFAWINDTCPWIPISDEAILIRDDD